MIEPHANGHFQDRYYALEKEMEDTPGLNEAATREMNALFEKDPLFQHLPLAPIVLPFHMVLLTSLIRRSTDRFQIVHHNAYTRVHVFTASRMAQLDPNLVIVVNCQTLSGEDWDLVSMVYSLGNAKNSCIVYHRDDYISCALYDRDHRREAFRLIEHYFTPLDHGLAECGVCFQDELVQVGAFMQSDSPRSEMQLVLCPYCSAKYCLKCLESVLSHICAVCSTKMVCTPFRGGVRVRAIPQLPQ